MIRFRSQGDRELSSWEKRVIRWAQRWRRMATPMFEVRDKQWRSRFVCESDLDAWRAVSLWIKEPGTMQWIDMEVRPGDVFLDIGANVGLYTIAAAHRVGESGKVFAVEPHRANVMTLHRNVAANRYGARVQVLPIGLADKADITRLNYASLESASTGSQVGREVMAMQTENQTFKPVASEIVLTTTVDALIDAGAMGPPHLVKMDVDGLEPAILRGMERMLRAPTRPRSIQVEVNVGDHADVVGFMQACGYAASARNYTKIGAALVAEGADADAIAHNVVFVPS